MPSSDTAVTGLAGRYAVALFELAESENALDQVADDLGRLQGMLDESGDLRRTLASPVVSRDAQGAVMAEIVKQAEMHALTAKFTGLVAQKRRLGALPRMIRGYQALISAKKGETTATVVSAKKLSDQQTEDLAAALKKGVGTDVQLDVAVDASLLGGMIVKVGSRMIDSSLRTKLEQLRLTMKGVA